MSSRGVSEGKQGPRRVGRTGRVLATLIAVAASQAAAPGAAAHGGGLDAAGCHRDRRSGGYHCHRSGPAASAPSRPAGDPARSAFPNCAAARAAGAAPIRRGEPGYGSHLDRDNDGVACEPYRGR